MVSRRRARGADTAVRSHRGDLLASHSSLDFSYTLAANDPSRRADDPRGRIERLVVHACDTEWRHSRNAHAGERMATRGESAPIDPRAWPTPDRVNRHRIAAIRCRSGGLTHRGVRASFANRSGGSSPSLARHVPGRRAAYEIGDERLVHRWFGYALANLCISSGSQAESGRICHKRSINSTDVIPNSTRISSSAAPPYGAHMLANSMRCCDAVSGCLRSRLASIGAARRL